MQVHQYTGDGTNQDAIQKDKIHVSEIMSTAAALHTTDGDTEQESDWASCPHRAICELQVVEAGTAKELMAMMKNQFNSVGCPMWHEVADAVFLGLLTVYIFSLDKGPDNQGGMRIIRERVILCRHCMILLTWCFFHQDHLIVKAVIEFLNGWEWSDHTLPAKYYSGVAIVANTWRSSGINSKLEPAAVNLGCGDVISKLVFGKIPGRPIGGRWGCIDSIESVICKGLAMLFLVFSAVLGPLLAKTHKPKAHPVDDECDDYQAKGT